MHFPSVPHDASTLRVAAWHSRFVWHAPCVHWPLRQRSKPGQSPSPWHGGWHFPPTHFSVELPPDEQSVSCAHWTHLPPPQMRSPVPAQFALSRHLMTHLLFSHSRLLHVHCAL